MLSCMQPKVYDWTISLQIACHISSALNLLMTGGRLFGFGDMSFLELHDVLVWTFSRFELQVF